MVSEVEKLKTSAMEKKRTRKEEAVSAPLGTAIVAADCATMDGDKGKSKRAKTKKEKHVKVVTVQDTSKVELEVKTVEPLSLEAEAANAMDVEVKKVVDSASIDTVAVSSVVGEEAVGVEEVKETADCATMDGDKGKSKRAKIEKEKHMKVVTVQDTSKVELEVKTVEPLSLEAEAANAMDVEVKKIVDSASIDTVAVSSVVGEEAVGVEEEEKETGEKGKNAPGGGKPGKKRKIAVLLAYCGAGYQGMQRNPGAITIEGELEQAFFRANAIAQCNFGDLKKVDWMRAARTDKGVSAVGQVVSARLVIEPPGFVERVNEHLPKEIRVFGYKRATSNFNAKQMCDKRRYEYIVPVFAFDPHAHHDRETILAWTEKRDNARLQRIERRKALEVKVAGGESEVVIDTSGSNNGTVLVKATEGTEVLEEVRIRKETTTTAVVETAEVGAVPKEENEEERVPYVFGEEEKKRLNKVLSKYCGTHNFHNFTARMKPEDPSAKRYMISFTAGDIFEINGMQFVRCTVVGQSFMLHQIRKMIGMAIAIMRGCAPDSIIDIALRRDADVNVPMAPELGLFLDECYYTAYNSRFKHTHEEITQKGYEKEIQQFKQDVLYAHIATQEVRDGTMALWLHSLNDRNFPDFVTARESESVASVK